MPSTVTYDEHIAQVNRFISDSFTLRQQGSGMLAAESVWGAAIQAMAAIDHALTPGSQRHPQHENFIINLPQHDSLTLELRRRFRVVKNRLHNHFYTGRLTAGQFDESMESGNVLVRQLLGIAERIRNPG